MNTINRYTSLFIVASFAGALGVYAQRLPNDFLAAERALASGDRRLARKLFRELIQRQPSWSRAHERLAESFIDNNELADGIESFRGLLKAPQENANTHAGLAMLWNAAGRVDSALAHGRRAIFGGTTLLSACELTVLLARAHQQDSVLQAQVEKLWNENPRHLAAGYALAYQLFADGRLDVARQLAIDLQNQFPADWRLYHFQALIDSERPSKDSVFINLRRGMAAAEAASDSQAVGALLYRQIHSYLLQGDTVRAAPLLNRLRKLGATSVKIKLLVALADARHHQVTTRDRAALPILQQARTLAMQRRDGTLAHRASHMLGSSYFAMGNSTESMYAYAFAQRIADSLRVVTLQLSTQIGLGYARDNLGQYEPAVYVTAEKMALACGAQQHLPYIWAGMAKLRELDRAYNEANALRKKQIAMSRHLGRHDMEIAGMEALARNYMSVRNYPAANSALNEAIKASLRYRNSLRAFDLKLAQGDLAKRLRNYDLASKHYQDARRLAESLSGKAMEICLMKIGDLWLSRGDCESAEKEYRHAYETTLKRVAAQGLEGGSLDLAASSEILSSFTKGLMHCEKAQESLALARQTRLHVLRKTLAAKVKAEVNMGGRYAEIHHRIDSLEQEIGQTADTTKTINLQNRILFWRSRLRALRPSASDSLWLAEMTKNLQPLPALQKSLVEQNAVALFFLVGQNATVVFAIHPDTLMGRLVSINKDTLRDRVLKIGSFFALDQGQPSTQGVFLKVQLTVDSKAARRLLEELVYPVLPKLPDKLILIPDDVLCLLPFDLLLASARLADKPKPPMSDLRLDGIPRTQIALTLEDIIPNVVQQPCKALLMANELPVLVNGRRILPPLSSALQEVENIADLLPAGASKKAANEKATRDFFFANAPDYGVYHFATHVQLSDWSPDYAKLYFGGPNGKSEPMYDFQLDRLDSVRAKLAVLSACNTALGRFQPGSGLLSFVLSFTDIGVPSVVASLWPVDDNITKELMVVFYDGLRKGYSYSAALALAKQHLIQDGHTNPHEWAGFVLFGKDGVLKFQEDRSARFLKYLLALVLTVALLAILRRFFPSRAIAAKS